ncbi:MAG TPA: hypothetical protein ENF75_03865 [Acidilobales archaeon]|nr:MAG: hypothetical protein B6U85_04130 [Desulfurococcales archaeon ex4484_42]HDD26207.1 hypothetical protein [Acidilobales archaeon]
MNYVICSDYLVKGISEIKRRMCLVISNGVIEDIKPYEPKELPRGYEKLNYVGKHTVITHGFASSHTHLGLYPIRSTLLNKLELDAWVKRYVWPWELELRRRPELSYHTALIALKELVSSGVTLVIDMHPNGSEVAKALIKYGVRGNICTPVMEGGAYKSIDESLKENLRLLNEWHGKHELITVGLCPCTVRLASKEAYEKCIELALKYSTNIHTHLSEVVDDIKYTLSKYGKRPAHYLLELGIGKVKTIIAHGVWLTLNEIRALSSPNITLITNPRSNYLLRSGKPQLRHIVKYLNTGLGVDVAPTYNIIDEILFLKFNERWLAPHDMYRLLTEGYRALSIGKGFIDVDEVADVTVWRLNACIGDPLMGVLQGVAKPSLIMVNGAPIYRDDKFKVAYDEFNKSYSTLLDVLTSF